MKKMYIISLLSVSYMSFLTFRADTTYDGLLYELWYNYFQSIDAEIIEIGDLKFINDGAIYSEFTDIFLSDPTFNFHVFDKIKFEAAKLLSFLNNEGPYQSKQVYLERDDIVVDAGANIGIFSIFAALNTKQVYAFEPSKETIELLKENISLNNLQNKIKVQPVGLSNEDKEVSFYYNEMYGHISSNMMQKLSNSVESKINCVTLDKWVIDSNIPKIDFIKADIEGAERLMLQGAKSVLKRFEPKLAICTYHYPDDPKVLSELILDSNPKYKIEHTPHKIFAYVP